MHGHWQPQAGCLAHAFDQREIVGAGKLGQARIAHERFEADHSPFGHGVHVTDASRHESAPDAEINNRSGLEGRSFAVEIDGADRARGGVQRHVEEQRAAARRQRAATGRRTLPLCPTRFVEVEMHIDQSGQDGETNRVDLFATTCQLRANRDNHAVLDGQIGSTHTIGGNDVSAAYDYINHARSPRETPTPSPVPQQHLRRAPPRQGDD